ncbi:MAG: hypothetical protein DDT25_01345 [Chloroflexi bacterium]|nr:hypothetical protein [Chloroflexota bacterium]
MLLCELSALNTGLEFWEYAKEVHPLVTNVVQLFVPIGYLLAAAAPLTLYLLIDIHWLAAFRIEALFAIGLITWPVLSFVAIGGGFRLAVRSWEAMEI